MSLPIALVVFLLTSIAGRVINERAQRQLTAEQKAELLDAFSSQRAFGLIPLVVLVGIYFVLVYRTSMPYRTVTFGYFGALLVYLGIMFRSTQRTMRGLALPPSYMKLFGVGRVVQYLGVGVLLAALLNDVV